MIDINPLSIQANSECNRNELISATVIADKVSVCQIN